MLFNTSAILMHCVEQCFLEKFNAYWYESVKLLQYYCSSPCIHPVTHEETVILEENVV